MISSPSIKQRRRSNARRTLANAMEKWNGSETKLLRVKLSSKSWRKKSQVIRLAQEDLDEEIRIFASRRRQTRHLCTSVRRMLLRSSRGGAARHVGSSSSVERRWAFLVRTGVSERVTDSSVRYPKHLNKHTRTLVRRTQTPQNPLE